MHLFPPTPQRVLPALLLPWLLACPSPDDTGPKPDDTAETGPDTDDTGETADTDDTGDTGTPMGRGLSGWSGEAVVDTLDYLGFEDWYFIADEGLGEDLCRIRSTLAALSVREDCAVVAGGETLACTWAFDLLRSESEVVAESGVGCRELSGYDATDVSDLDGEVVSYGYVSDYFGHANILMVDGGAGDWQPATMATWDEATSELSYDWADGIFDYPEI